MTQRDRLKELWRKGLRQFCMAMLYMIGIHDVLYFMCACVRVCVCAYGGRAYASSARRCCI